MKPYIRPIVEEDLELLEPNFGSKGWPGIHRHRLLDQAAGAITYLIAFINNCPVGHCVILWEGLPSPPLEDAIADCPDLSDIYVAEDYRSSGLGTLLIQEAERSAVEQGFKRVGLAVGIDNPRAHDLYLRLGFSDAGQPFFAEEGAWVDDDGVYRQWYEECLYLTKPLG